MDYEVLKQIVSSEARNLFLCIVWGFNTGAFLTNFGSLIGRKEVDKTAKNVRTGLMIFSGIMTIVSFIMLLYFFKKL